MILKNTLQTVTLGVNNESVSQTGLSWSARSHCSSLTGGCSLPSILKPLLATVPSAATLVTPTGRCVCVRHRGLGRGGGGAKICREFIWTSTWKTPSWWIPSALLGKESRWWRARLCYRTLISCKAVVFSGENVPVWSARNYLEELIKCRGMHQMDVFSNLSDLPNPVGKEVTPKNIEGRGRPLQDWRLIDSTFILFKLYQ